MKRIPGGFVLRISLLVAIGAAQTGCAATAKPPQWTGGVYQQPPPALAEDKGAPPGGHSLQYYWVSGRWLWMGKWFWLPGRWEQHDGGQRWIDGYWTKVGDQWVWAEGRMVDLTHIDQQPS